MSEIMPDKRFTEVVNGQQVVRALAVSGDIIPEPAKDPSKYFTALVNTEDGPQQVVKVLPIGSDGNPLTIDAELSTVSENPVQNKVVTEAINENSDAIYENTEAIDAINAELDTNPPWKNPASWPDIRMGAVSHSYYFLVAHSTPVESEGSYTIANYPKFSFSASISTAANSYDVYVDGLKVASATSGTTTTIDWEALYTAGTVVGGYNVDNPSSMVAHIVRITPATSTDAIQGVSIANYSAGTLWAHITEENPVNLDNFLAKSSYTSPLCQAVTTNQPTLVFTSASSAFSGSVALLEVPILEQVPDSVSGNKYTRNLMQGCSRIKRVRLKNIKNVSNEGYTFFSCTRLEKIEAENCVFKTPNFYECVNLKSLGGLCMDFSEVTNISYSFNACRSLEPFFLDVSNAPLMTGLTVNTDRYNPVNGLKGIVVDNTAPFNRTSSPQINVSYTGLDRIALVNLFKSMPYNVGYTAVGSPTITGGVASGFSNSNYLQLTQQFDITKDFECVFSVKTGSSDTISNYQRVWFYDCNGTNGIWINNRVIYWWVASNDSSKVLNNGNYTVQADTDYLIRARHIDGVYYLDHSIDNGQTWRTATSKEFTHTGTTQATAYLGNSTDYQYAWLGSMNLNNTYITVNGVPWFKGTAAVTKTCSIVGCTGTADLTQTDKDIALDKGWSLTVA